MADKEAFLFKKGDVVLGTINGEPARGKVIGVKANTITIERRGPAIEHKASKQMMPGAIEHHEAKASDFELLYRKPVKETKK